jgi:hypothetical protein
MLERVHLGLPDMVAADESRQQVWNCRLHDDILARKRLQVQPAIPEFHDGANHFSL